MRRHTLIRVGLVTLLLVAATRSPVHAAEELSVLLVIINPQNPRANVSAAELRQIFMGQKTVWEDGTPIVPLNFPANTGERVFFDEKVLRMSSDQAQAHWVAERIRTGNKPPAEVPSSLLLQRVVQQSRGAIAYVRAKQVAGNAKTVTVDGNASEAAGYLLKP